MKTKLRKIGIFLLLLLAIRLTAWGDDRHAALPADATPGQYLPLLQHKRVALIINQTSVVNGVSLADMLLREHIQVVKIFVPEHGFRGTEDAGAHIENSVDSATHLPVISLYGNHKKPAPAELSDVDVLVYDLQDVGVRFYTYISTLQYCMEASAEEHKTFVVLDRPDPNGFYVDGPVLDTAYRSFVGMLPVPVVYGMTAGEYARMLAGEHWMAIDAHLDLKVIPCTHYDHSMKYVLPVAPSPNLRTMAAVYAYPSLCLFEGTPVSVGRGTTMPFQQYGCPQFKGVYTDTFTPRSMPGAHKPPYENMECFGEVVARDAAAALPKVPQMQLQWLLRAWKTYPDKEHFFTPFFKKLCGSRDMEQQISEGWSEPQIRDSWQDGLNAFRKIRKKYLLYKDFP